MNNKVLLYLYSVDDEYAAAAVNGGGVIMMNINLQMYNHAHGAEYIYVGERGEEWREVGWKHG